MAFQKAVKSQAKLRLTFDGPAGSGKTYSSLVLARELAGPGGSIAVIDTEHRTASKYAGLFNFDQQSPDEFSLDTYLKLIREAKGYDVLVIDSLSHAWMGKGGAMEEVDRAGGTNKFTGWRTVTPKHNELIDAIIGFPGHVICTMRKKMEYVLETDSKGKQVPKKVGMAPVQREGMEYEFDVVADLDTDGNITIAKTRCPELHARRNQLRHADVPELGTILKAWLTDGIAAPAPKPADHSKIVDAFKALNIPLAQLEDRLQAPLAMWTEADVATLKTFWAEAKKSPPPSAAELEARRILTAENEAAAALRAEAAKAEAGIAAEAAKKAAAPVAPPVEVVNFPADGGPVVPARIEADRIYKGFAERVLAATTPGNVAMVVAEAAAAHLTPGDLKALQRTATDRTLVLKDAEKFPPKRRVAIDDKSTDVPQ